MRASRMWAAWKGSDEIRQEVGRVTAAPALAVKEAAAEVKRALMHRW
jgi:hypothetical protein